MVKQGIAKCVHSLFFSTKLDSFTAILVYVDDIIIATADQREITSMRNLLSSHFKLRELDDLKYFIGLEIACSQHGIAISQRKFTVDLLAEYGLTGAKPISTPIVPNH
ncbi:hypothetical protein L6164_026061 [Bauhinia variegata]|uniref:Uncharacterized protein n=1 Tax=Bauhinia variegata TaxID=167791 RepID=A0ACB9M478_BAUVA|nr:hypothetical protein L6164_026061 [Bauhinia variegata]